MATFDLDAARAARAEKRGPAPTVTIDGHEWTLVHELPMVALERLDMGQVTRAMRMIVDVQDGESFDDFPVETLSADDAKDLIGGLYGDPTS